jgi:PKD repeat protein
MSRSLEKTGDPPQKRPRNLLKASVLATSMGTLLPTTGLAATIQGTSFFDMNDNGTREACEPVRANATIFIRDNNLANAGMGGFFTAFTDANGRYQSPAHNAGPFTIWADIPFGQRQTSPVRGEGFVMHDFTIASPNQTVTIDFGIFDPTPNGAPNVTVPNARMTVNMDSQVNFTANFNDGDGDTLCAATWDFGDGSTANSLNATHAYTAPGSYTARISVTDSRGATGSAQVRVTVQNVRPTVTLTANPTTVGICNATRITGTATDTASDRLTHRLTLGDGNTVNGLTANHTYTTPRRYTARLVSTDRFGATGQATVAITVQNTSPTVNASFASNANPIRITDVINFSGQVTDPDTCDRHTYQWTFGDGGTANTLNASHNYTTKGTYTATLTVRDRFGGVTRKTLRVTVLGALPVVRLGQDIALDVAEPFNFSGTFTDADGQPRYDYIWRFGDGNTSVGRTWSTRRALGVTHAFNQAGEFTVTLEVTDKDGNTGSDSMIVNVRGINTDPCATGVATVRSQLPWGLWDRPNSWNTGRIPGPNDWVLIQGGHNVILPTSVSSATTRLQVKGLCIKPNGLLQSYFNSLTTPPTWVHLYVASLRNQGTIMGAGGVNGAGPYNNVSRYRHATKGGSIKIFAYKVVNDTTGQILGNGRGGDDLVYKYFPNQSGTYRYSRGSAVNAKSGAGGQVEIYVTMITNNGLIQGGNGGFASTNDRTDPMWSQRWYSDRGKYKIVFSKAHGGDGGFVRVFASNLPLSTNGSTGKIIGGNGGDAIWFTKFSDSGPGKGGTTAINLGNNFGTLKTGKGGRWSRWEPILLKASSTTRIEGSEEVVIFAPENATIDLRELSEGSISATNIITIAAGKGGVVDLPDFSSGKVFKAGTKVEIFADKIKLNGKVLSTDKADSALKNLADAPSVTVSPAKILYSVEWSHAEQMVGEPGATMPVNLTLLNGGPTADTYTVSMVDSAGWEIGELPSTVTVNSLRRSDLAFDVTLPTKRGEEDIITITATSLSDPSVQAVAKIRVGVREEESITPRGDEKADITLVIENTNTMSGEMLMVSNAIEVFLGNFDGEDSPADEKLKKFLEQFDENNPPTDAELDAFFKQIHEEFPPSQEALLARFPMVELITFKDDVTSRVVTKDLGDIIARIRSIQASGNRDCPTTTVAALESALDNLNPNGQIFLVTSASPQGDTAAAIAKAQQLGVKVHILLAGSCGDEEADKAIYQQIVDQTGGDFNQVRRGQMPAVEIEQVVTTVVEDTITEVAEMVKERGNDDDTDEEPPVTPASCMVYGVQDKGKNDSIFFSIDFETGEVKQIGPVYEGYDIEAMAVSRDKDILIVASGNDTDDPLPKGHVYYLDASTGDLVPIGPSGFEEIGGLAFAGDGTLWAWAKKDGLVQLDPVTGQGTLELPTPALLEDLTASRDGTMLYGPLDEQLWSYDPTTETLTLECDNLERETEAVEFLLDGILLIGRNGEKTLMLHGFDIATCSMVAHRNIKVPFNDVEGLAVPHAACLR